MMTTLSHPFIDHPELLPVPEDKIKDVDELFKWIQEQPEFPNYTKNHAYQFLHACYWDLDNTKKALRKYCEIRATALDIFDDRDPMHPDIQFVFNMAQMFALPKKTPEGYHILIYRLINSDPSKMHFGNAVKAFCMFNDLRISEDLLTEGYVVVFDMKGLRLGHMARVQIGPLRSFMSYIQEAHPVRLKKVYVVHTVSFIKQAMAIVKPFIKSDLFALLHFTTNGPAEIFDKEILPQEYEGTEKPCLDFYVEQRKLIEEKYTEWLKDSGNLKEKPKIKEKSKKKASIKKSFRSLEID